MLSTTTVIFTAVCFLCGVERTQSVALVCLVQPCNNRALCPPVNCTSGTVYDSCRCCQQCGLPNGSVCDERRSPSDNGRYCAHGLVCEMNGSNVEGICKGIEWSTTPIPNCMVLRMFLPHNPLRALVQRTRCDHSRRT